MHHSNKHENEVGKEGPRGHFYVFMVPALYRERAAKHDGSCFTGNREKPLKADFCFLIACQCIGLRDEQLSRDHLGRLRKCQPSLAEDS